MLVSAIIQYIRDRYPKVNNTTNYPDSLFITDLDLIHKEEYVKFKRLKNRYTTDSTLTTVANQLEYTFPTNCVIENISGEQIYVTIDNQDYIFEYADGDQDISTGDYYRYGSTDAKFELLRDGKAIDTAGYTITIRYYPEPTAITLATQTPDLESKYHNLLIYRLFNRMAMLGENPDATIANVWQTEYNTAYEDIKKHFEANKSKTTTTITRIKDVYGA
jgi:hypothetical protein